MPMMRLQNIPKPIRNSPVVRHHCPTCNADTPHYMFTTEPNYVGPIIFYPLSKLASKHIQIICINCLHMVEIESEYAQKCMSEYGDVENENIDRVQNAIVECYKSLSQILTEESAYFHPSAALKERFRSDKQAAFVRYRTIIAAVVNNMIESRTKKCPFCKEEIKLDATKCRYCGSMLE